MLAVCAALAPATAPAAVLTVTTLADLDAADGDCSLREAIVAANSDAAHQECAAGAGADEIEIAVPGTISLLADLPQITHALTLRGLGAGASEIAGGGFELVHFTDAAAGNGELLRLEGLLLTGGSASAGGAVFAGTNRALEIADCVLMGNQSSGNGGAVRADRTVSVEIVRSSVIGNTAGAGGGGLAAWTGTVDVVDSTFAGNTAAGGPGGAIYALSVDQFVVRQSTVSANSATADGGGVAAVSGPARIESSTLVGNQADSDGDDSGDGGGFSVAGSTGTLVSTLLAGNQDLTPSGGSICPDGLRKLGGTIATEGFNLVGANDCISADFPPGQPNVNGDQVGTSAAPIDAVLSLLDDHGGPTLTHLPLPASPAIDRGSCPTAAADQRGYGSGGTLTRIVDDPGVPDLADGCDVGAVEAGAIDLVGLVFADGFESGDSTAWSSTTP